MWGRKAGKDVAPYLEHIRSHSTAAVPFDSTRNPQSFGSDCWAIPAKAVIPNFPSLLTPSPLSVSFLQYSFPQGLNFPP